MESSNQLEVLANSAIQSKNYSQAFDYYSKLLESDISNSQYWINKGISAGWLSTPDNPRFDEMIFCIQTAKEEYSATREALEYASTEIRKVIKSKMNNLLLFINKEIERRFDNKEIGSLTLTSVHNVGRIGMQLDVGNEYSPVLIKLVDTANKNCQLIPSESSYKDLVYIIDLVLKHSSNNSDYFKIHKDSGNRFSEILKMRDLAILKLKEINKDAEIPPQPRKDSSSCFIATAASGDINHPTVIQLRKFRDNNLINFSIGRKFVKFYYEHSPRIAMIIEKNKTLRFLIYHFFIRPISDLTKIFTKNKLKKHNRS